MAIILIGILYNTVEGEKEDTHEHEKKPEVVKEAKVSFHDHFRAVVKERKKKSELVFPFIVGLIVAIIGFYFFPYNSIAIEVMFFGSVVIGFIVFVLLTLMVQHRVTKGFWALIGTKIFLILLLCGIAATAYDYYHIHKDFNASIGDYLAQNFLGQERIPTDGYVFTGEGTVVGSGLGNTGISQNNSSDVFSGTSWNAYIQEETGTVVGKSNDSTTSATTTPATGITSSPSIGNQKLMDAVIYLLKKNTIPLITKQDIYFTYVTFNNPYYNEWRTAYAKKLIGKSTNPSKYIICDSYIVMKWLLEKWNVSYTSTTVLSNFWTEAIRRGELNGCVKWKIVTDKTL